MNPKPPAIRRLRLRNYRSVRDETITFDNPLFLVGRNGSGKSNVVDALAFLSDCMNIQLSAAIEKRGGGVGIGNIDTHDNFPYVEIKIELTQATYRLRLNFSRDEGFTVAEEEARINDDDWFFRKGTELEWSLFGAGPKLSQQGLLLPVLSGVESFSLLFESLIGIRVHHINPQAIRLSDSSGVSESAILNFDGSNVAGVIANIEKKHQGSLNSWLDAMIPGMGIQSASTKNGRKSLFFNQRRGQTEFGDLTTQWYTLNVSHGTLEALGVIVALHQEPTPSLVVIEEPETNLHPGALAVIADLIQEASERMQIVITTHSPELLDQKWIGAENLRVVTWEDGETRVSPVSPLAQAALTDHLKRRYAGQLLRTNLLQSAPHKTE